MTISTGRHLNFFLSDAFVGGGVACAVTASVFADGGSPFIFLSYLKFSQADISKSSTSPKIIFALVFREQFTLSTRNLYGQCLKLGIKLFGGIE